MLFNFKFDVTVFDVPVFDVTHLCPIKTTNFKLNLAHILQNSVCHLPNLSAKNILSPCFHDKAYVDEINPWKEKK